MGLILVEATTFAPLIFAASNREFIAPIVTTLSQRFNPLESSSEAPDIEGYRDSTK